MWVDTIRILLFFRRGTCTGPVKGPSGKCKMCVRECAWEGGVRIRRSKIRACVKRRGVRTRKKGETETGGRGGEGGEEDGRLLIQSVDDGHQPRNVPHVFQGDRSLGIALV